MSFFFMNLWPNINRLEFFSSCSALLVTFKGQLEEMVLALLLFAFGMI